jgi:malonyl-CoA decarboxylase
MALNARLTRVIREVRRWRSGAADPIPVDPDLHPSDWRHLSAEIQAIIDGRGGPVTARRRARTVGLTYETLSPSGRLRFFEHLAADHGHDDAAVDRAIDRVVAAAPGERRATEADLRRVLRPGHEVLLRLLAGQAGGLAFLVALRADLLPHRRGSPELSALDDEVRQILENWFDVGLLRLERLTWDTSAAFLEKLIQYEAVHAIESWDDLKRRLGPGRRCYAFIHPAMPDDPLIFVEVALTKDIPDRLGPLLHRIPPDDGTADEAVAKAQREEERAETAVFYSISNCHRGLAGVSLGDFLIKSVAEELSTELTNLRTFATLSPLPGFRAWLRDWDDERGPLPSLEADADPDDPEVGARLLHELVAGPPRGPDDPEMEALRPVLCHLAARYVTEVGPGGRAIDPVAHFHLSNGAIVERINWMANPNPVGWDRGLCLMVNYRYDLKTIERNHDRYVVDGEVTMADDVRSLVQPPTSGDGRRRRR